VLLLPLHDPLAVQVLGDPVIVQVRVVEFVGSIIEVGEALKLTLMGLLRQIDPSQAEPLTQEVLIKLCLSNMPPLYR
jgi:hypothetical protein